MNFGERLKHLLDIKGLSMNQLANQTGISYNMIKKYCHFGAEPTTSYAVMIADALDVSLDELVKRERKHSGIRF